MREHGRALTLAEMRVLEEKVPEGVTIIAQHPGDLIYILPGWVHAVINMWHCIKFAVDLFVPTHLHMYALSMALVGSPYTSWRMVPDYMFSQHATVATLKDLWGKFIIHNALAQ